MSTIPPTPPSEPDKDDDFVVAGNWGEVRHARRRNGRMEAKEWLETATASEIAKFDHLFLKIANVGKISNEEHFRQLDGKIWEFKRDGNRILCFQHGRCWRLTHHYAKGGRQKCPRSEIDRAMTIRGEFLGAN